MHILFVFLVLIFMATWVVTNALNNGTCYNTNYIQDVEYSPCIPDAEVSSCCVVGDICLSNGLCESGNSSGMTPYSTGLCTEYYWDSPATCFEMCDHNKTG